MARCYVDPIHTAPAGFGLHPCFDVSKLREVPSANYYNPAHPGLYMVPNRDNVTLRESFFEDLRRIFIPFSSYDFYVNLQEGIYKEIWDSPTFIRSWRINQLGFLTPSIHKNNNESFLTKCRLSPCSRGLHSWVPTLMAGVLLSKFGFDPQEVACFQLTMSHHDHAMPAGGDSAIRVDKKNLSEELNFTWQMERFGRHLRWKDMFGFDLENASRWVKNQGTLGQFLDILDRISYVLYDCLNFASSSAGRVRNFLLDRPLIGDIWQKIRFSPDKQQVYFSDPGCLYDFLMLRALEGADLLFSPSCRCLDWYGFFAIKELYGQKILTKKILLTKDDEWLLDVLSANFPDHFDFFLNHYQFGWKKFNRREEALSFCNAHDLSEFNIEHIKGFKLGLDYLVEEGNGKLVPLKEVLSLEQIQSLEKIRNETIGFYVYYLK